MLKVGQRLGTYEVVAQLTSGGMATLFLARRVGAAGFARSVALKVVQPELARDPHFVRMFIDEAKLAARIQHPNVVHVEELGERDGFYFLAMEYVHGVSLAELLRELHSQKRRLAPAVATYIATQVADALHAAHETRSDKGRRLEVVHRDVSPQNILISSNGHVKLIDFGIAKALGRQSRTNVGALKGKLRYMSPEQAHGRPVDRSTDLYALGIVLWEMLTMRRLFRAPSELALLDQVRAPQIESPDTLVSDLPRGLVTAVMKTLSIEAKQRPASALELRRALASAVAGVEEVDSTQLAELLEVVLGPLLAERADLLPPDTRELTLGNAAIPDETPSVEHNDAFERTIDAALPQTQAGRPRRRMTPSEGERSVSERDALVATDRNVGPQAGTRSGLTGTSSARRSPRANSEPSSPHFVPPSAAHPTRPTPAEGFMDTVTVSMKELEGNEWIDIDLDDAIVEDVSADTPDSKTPTRTRSATPAQPRSVAPGIRNDADLNPRYVQSPQGTFREVGSLGVATARAEASSPLASTAPQRHDVRPPLSPFSHESARQAPPWAPHGPGQPQAMLWPGQSDGRIDAALAEAYVTTRAAHLVPSSEDVPGHHRQSPVSGTYRWDHRDSEVSLVKSDSYSPATLPVFTSTDSNEENAFASAVAEFDRTQARRRNLLRSRRAWVAAALLACLASAAWALLQQEAPRAALRAHLHPALSALLGLSSSPHLHGNRQITASVPAPTLPLQAAPEMPRPTENSPSTLADEDQTRDKTAEGTPAAPEASTHARATVTSPGATQTAEASRTKTKARPTRAPHRPRTRNPAQDADTPSEQVIAEVPIFSLPGR